MKPLIFIFLFCTSLACTKQSNSSVFTAMPTDTSTRSAKSYLALGDSYTIGQSVEADQRFPAQTAALLNQQGIKVSVPQYIAQTGWTTANLQNAIATQNPPSTYDIVTLLIGVNDQYQHMDTAGYASRFTQLLQKAIALANGTKAHVFVLSIPDYSVTPFVPVSDKARVRTEIDWFNASNKRITTAYNVSYTDITPISREAETNSSLIAGDGLHPSGAQYKKWAELLAPTIKAAFQ